MLRAKLYAILRVWFSPSKHRAYRAFISLGTSYLHRRGRCFRFFLLFFFKGVHLILAWSRSRIETRENSYHSHFFDNFNFNLRIEVIFISERYQFDDSNSRILHFLSRVILLYMVLHSIPRLCSFPSQAFHPHYFICAATRYHSKISAGTWSFQLRVYYRVCFRSWNSKPLARWEKLQHDRSPLIHLVPSSSKTKERECIRTVHRLPIRLRTNEQTLEACNLRRAKSKFLLFSIFSRSESTESRRKK